ncbi:MAG: PQQ-binding-like beta-propeller repeat protein [Muribaculaceae bacterium]
MMKLLHNICFRLFTAALVMLSVSINASAVKIAVLADVHVSPGSKNEAKLREAVAEINAGDAKLVIVAGDLSDEGSDIQLTNVKSILDGVSKPIYVIPGNHENNWSQSACKTFNDLWGNDRFVTETDSLVIVGINCGPYMKMGDGHIKQEDLSWLDKTLAERTRSGKRVLSVCHYPIMPDLDNCNDYVAVLQKYPIVSHICGHYHTFKYYKRGDINALMCRSLDMRNGNYGYSILDIDNDSVRLFDKKLGIDPVKVIAYKVDVDIAPLTIANADDSSELPDNVKISLIHRDEASIFTRVGVDNDNIYFGNSLGYAKSVNIATGKVNWTYKTDASLFSRPAVAKNSVIIPTADKRLVWLNKKSGKTEFVWNANGPYVADGIIRGNILYQGGSKTFQAWDVKKHKLIWHFDSIFNYCQAEPAIDGKNIAFGAWDTYLRLLDTSNGKLLWKWNNGKNINLFSPGNCVPVITHDKVIIVAPDRYMTAIDRNSGRQIWRNNDFKYRESLGVSADGKTAYAKTMDGEIVAVSTEGNEFKLLWKIDAELGYEHAPCLVVESKGIVFLGSLHGVVVAIDPVAQTTLWRYRLGNSQFNGWDIDAKGNLYTSLIEGTVWRISIK